MIKEYGSEIRIISDDDGVVITGGGLSRLVIDDNLGFALSHCRIKGKKLGSSARLRATLGDIIAECRVSVEQRDEGLPNLKIEIVDERPSIFRALFDPPEVEPGEIQILKVFALHSSIKRYIGNPPDYFNIDSTEFRAVLAEIVTEAIVRRIVTRKYPAGTEDLYADTIYYDHVEYTSRLLPLMQECALKYIIKSEIID